MTVESVVLAASLIAYGVGATIYSRATFSGEKKINRGFFVLKLMATMTVIVIAFECRPTATSVLTVLITGFSLWDWRRHSLIKMQSGVVVYGAARMLADHHRNAA